MFFKKIILCFCLLVIPDLLTASTISLYPSVDWNSVWFRTPASGSLYTKIMSAPTVSSDSDFIYYTSSGAQEFLIDELNGSVLSGDVELTLRMQQQVVNGLNLDVSLYRNSDNLLLYNTVVTTIDTSFNNNVIYIGRLNRSQLKNLKIRLAIVNCFSGCRLDISSIQLNVNNIVYSRGVI